MHYTNDNPGGLCQVPSITWLDRTPKRAGKNADVYYQPNDGLSESKHVYVRGNRLAERFMQATDECVVAEVGFGVGVNFVATCQAFLQAYKNNPCRPRLVYVAFEPQPLSTDQMRYALANWSHIHDISKRLLAIWPPLIAGCYPLWFSHNILLIIHFRPIQDCQLHLIADAWFYDAFSPSYDSSAWSDTVIANIAKWSTSGTTLSTFSVAAKVRQALTRHGFCCVKCPGFGKKRHMLTAKYVPQFSSTDRCVRHQRRTTTSIATHDNNRQHTRIQTKTLCDISSSWESAQTFSLSKKKPLRIAVIGGGLAGCATAWALAQLGAKVSIFERRQDIAQRASSHTNAVLFAKPSWRESPQQHYLWSCWSAMWSFLSMHDDMQFCHNTGNFAPYRMYHRFEKEILGDSHRMHSWVTKWHDIWRARAHGNWLVPAHTIDGTHPAIKLLRSGVVNLPLLAKYFADSLYVMGCTMYMGTRVVGIATKSMTSASSQTSHNAFGDNSPHVASPVASSCVAVHIHKVGEQYDAAHECLVFDKVVIAANTGSLPFGVANLHVAKGQVYTHAISRPMPNAIGTSKGYIAPFVESPKKMPTKKHSLHTKKSSKPAAHFAQSGGEFIHAYRSLRPKSSCAGQHWENITQAYQSYFLQVSGQLHSKECVKVWADARTNGRDHMPIVGTIDALDTSKNVFVNVGYGGKGALAIVPTSFWLAQQIMQKQWGLSHNMLDVLCPQRFKI